ncbi:MAG TPA: phosphatase PAP2 family protein [Propionicimonas sp.]|jgi:membrane-associated phospholipid phosphatase
MTKRLPPRQCWAALVVATCALLYLFAVWTPAGLSLDSQVLASVAGLPLGVSELVGDVLSALFAPVVLAGLVGLMVLAVRSRRIAAPALAVLAGLLAAATAEVLKVALPGRPGDPAAPLSSPLDLLNPEWWARVHDGPIVLSGSFPGGHATTVTALALAVLTAMTPRLARRAALPVMILAATVSGATVLAGWHRPSDAVAGMLLAVAWWLALVPGAGLQSACGFAKRGRRSTPWRPGVEASGLARKRPAATRR